MAKSKPKPVSDVPGVRFQSGEKPAWFVVIHWLDRGKRRELPAETFPVDPNALSGDALHVDVVRAIAEGVATRHCAALVAKGIDPCPMKPSSQTPGVYYRDDGKPRWEVRIRWVEKGEGKKPGKPQRLPTEPFPFDPRAKKGSPLHFNTVRISAEKWAETQWRALKDEKRPHYTLATGHTLRSLLLRYQEDIKAGLITHKSVKTENSACNVLLGTAKGHNSGGFPDLVDKFVTDLTYQDFFDLKNPLALSQLLKDSKGEIAGHSSLRRLLNCICMVFKRAKDEWGVDLVNPLESITGLVVQDQRDRVLSAVEWDTMTAALASCEQGTQDVVHFARFTAARRAECVKLNWQDIHFTDRTALLRETKSKADKVVDRLIPLPKDAWDIIKKRSEAEIAKRQLEQPKAVITTAHLSGAIFTSDAGQRIRADTVTQAWSRARTKVGITDVRVHDLRHTRITEMGRILTAAESARVSGHVDLKTFFRYFNPDASQTGKKLDLYEQRDRNATDVMRRASEALAVLTPDELAQVLADIFSQRSKNAAGQ